MSLKNFLIFSSGGILFSRAKQQRITILAIFEKHFCEIILFLEHKFRRKCRLKVFLLLWRPFCLAELNGLCKFGRKPYQNHLCE